MNKAVTFGFDDGEIYDRALCELFRQYGMRATFFLITSQFSFSCPFHRYGEDTVVERVSADELPVTYRDMEVANHTAFHRFTEDIKTDVTDAADTLSRLCGYRVRGFAYPGGVYTDRQIKALKETDTLYARTTESTYSFDLPENLLVWNPTCKYDDPMLPELTDRFLSDTSGKPQLLYIYGHSYELSRKEEPYNWKSFERILKKLSGKSDILYATNSQAVEWMKNVRSYH